MKPTFKNTLDWEQAQLLMQPAFIRVLDNLRQQLEKSTWEGTYHEVQSPYPGYQLLLTYQEHSVKIDIWDICFQVCFLDYESSLDQEEQSLKIKENVQIDTNLIKESGEVSWEKLEAKTKSLINDIFENLPVI
ncbi:hypothetical protein VB715_14400 [Crocosphaera sp. UHCC 0190]|uniref:hypothetical protein n=1 Tax=Crocosphaera sp. UHCC 0190 TaxID=3110246 RepID=UPI002B203855|nr:hypothetical protein [Crocosphaera sp. UHCC 0190]MEA5510961.1 hypothetical protein [Crocosphaera sp. UHCC 0190]